MKIDLSDIYQVKPELNSRQKAHMRLVVACAAVEEASQDEHLLRKTHLQGFREGVYASCKLSLAQQAQEADSVMRKLKEEKRSAKRAS